MQVLKGFFPRIPDAPKYPEKILFCGWRRDIDDMIMVIPLLCTLHSNALNILTFLEATLLIAVMDYHIDV